MIPTLWCHTHDCPVTEFRTDVRGPLDNNRCPVCAREGSNLPVSGHY